MSLIIIQKKHPDATITFELVDQGAKKTIVSSDLVFAEKFLHTYWTDEQWQEILALAIIDLTKQDPVAINKQIFLGTIGGYALLANNRLQTHIFNQRHTTMLRLPQDKKLRLYAALFHACQFLNPEGYYNGTSKLASLQELFATCNEKTWLDGLYFSCLEAIDQIKSPQAEMMVRIKAFQEDQQMKALYDTTFHTSFRDFLLRKQIDTICIIPNNVKRQTSFNAYIETLLIYHYPQYQHLHVNVHNFEGRKPQKSIRSICDRITNATKLFSLDQQASLDHSQRILLLDDVFGSGATMNAVARKIKEKNPTATVLGFAILASYRKGFDVLQEM